MKILLSAYACEPGRGSEPGVGWNMAKTLAEQHPVWLLTSHTHRHAIDAEFARHPRPNLHVVYLDPLGWKLDWSRRFSSFAVYAHYYLWQVWAYFVGKSLHRRVGFDLAHHVTYVKYSTPSFLSLLPMPFFFGPVGGGESAPKAFYRELGPRARIYEILRSAARKIGEWDPFVRLTVRRSAFIWATTDETSARLRDLGARNIQVSPGVALDETDVRALRDLPPAAPTSRNMRFISMGRLLHWKGFHLGLRAFAHAELHDAEYSVVGDGPERRALAALVKKLGIESQVTFWGDLDRQAALSKLGECDVLVHPSLHDSGGWVCLEAMAAARPVICLALGGPGLQVTSECGFRISARGPAEAVTELAAAMRQAARNRDLIRRMGEAGQRRVEHDFTWTRHVERVVRTYGEATGATVATSP